MASVSFTSKLGNFYDSALYWGYVDVPVELAKKVSASNRRVVCTLNHDIEFHCALMHNGKGGFFINVKKEYQKKLNVLQTS